MKIKTSVSLSHDLLDAMADFGGDKLNRSEIVEAAVRAYLAQQTRTRINERDRRIIEANAEGLNAEAEDVLAYQTLP